MHDAFVVLARTLALGVGATAALDLWSLVRARMLHVPSLDYALVGRWLAWLPRGRFVHAPIAATAPVRGERALGWSAHYLVGIAFAAMLVLAWPRWPAQPTLLPALLVGVGSVLAPLLLLQPALGLGIAARRAPRPARARAQALLSHAVFGLGLYATGIALAACWPA